MHVNQCCLSVRLVLEKLSAHYTDVFCGLKKTALLLMQTSFPSSTQISLDGPCLGILIWPENNDVELKVFYRGNTAS